MSDISYPIHAMLVPADDIDGWVSWCPEVGSVSQGETAEHALGMIIDSIVLISHFDLLAFGCKPDPHDLSAEVVETRDRVWHPLRRSKMASYDEDWPLFKRVIDSGFSHSEFRWTNVVSIHDSLFRLPIVVKGNLLVNCRGGTLQTFVSFSEHGFCFDPS